MDTKDSSGIIYTMPELNEFHLAKVTKTQFEYWYGKKVLKNAVKLSGDVSVLVLKKDFEEYTKTRHTPTKVLEIAMYENYKKLKGVFNEQ